MQIEEISTCGDLTKVIPVHGQPIAIKKSSFEKWADEHFKREYGDVEGYTGEASWEEYYDSEHYEADLVEYIQHIRKVAAAMKQFDRVIGALTH